MSEFLTPNSKRWAALEAVRKLYMDRSIAGNLGGAIGNEILQNLHKIHDKKLNITVENWQSYFVDSRDYIGGGSGSATAGGFGINWFSPVIDLSEKELEERFNGALDETVLRLMVNTVKYWKIEENELVLSEDFATFRNESAKSTLADRTLLMVENGTIDKITTKVIGTILSDYSFDLYKKEISKKITSLMQDTSKTFSFVFDSKFYNEYIGLEHFEESGEKFYKLSDTIYKDGSSKKIPAKFLDDNFEILLLLQEPATTQYPNSIIQTNNGISEDLKKSLQEFNGLENTDLANYPFEFLINPFTPATHLGINVQVQADDNVFVKWFKDGGKKEVTTKGHIGNIIKVNYFNFLSSLVADIRAGGQLETSIGTQFQKILEFDSISQIFSFIVYDKIIAAKKSLFDSIADSVSDDDDTPGELTEEEIEAAFKSQIETFKEGKPPELPDQPSEEDIANRQKFFKQCALMLNMSELRDVYQQELNSKYSGKLPFDGRFTTLGCKDEEQELMLTRLVSSKKEQLLFELETHKVSRLVPKVRLFKVFHDPNDGEKEVEFVFSRTSKQRDSFLSAEFDKGNGVGLKNFSFEFNGTSPATARNDITASLTLFFQSFEDFTRSRKASDEDDYRYVDLIIQPTPDKEGEVGGIEIQSDRQYEPQFYRIRADVGYVLPTEADGFTSDEIEALRVSNKSFFLNMVDHDISFGKDGTVEIKISYRAYLESLLKHPRLDALASPELISRRIANAREFAKQVQNKECSVEQLKELQISLAAQETVLVKQSLSSIITRLTKREAIYTALIKKEDKDFFLKKGFFRKCELEKDSIADGSSGVDVKLVLNSDLPESSDDFDFMDSANRSVQFFYFGDLLYTVLDCVYSEGNKVRKGTGFDRNSIILGSFEFEPFQQKKKDGNVYNIADIPISVDFFSRWFVDNVVNQKSTRKTFPLMNFVRSFSNNLIKPALIENCVNRKLETRLRFQTSQVTAFQSNGENPLSKHYNLSEMRVPVALDVETLRSGKDPTLPLKGGPTNDANSSFKDFHTFIVLSALGSTLSYSGNGNYGEDIEQGRFHVHIGQNTGLVKTLSLSKSDQQYIREARFFQNGIDGLLQLSAVYVANIEMFGNTLFYPGMEFFFNPYGIGGPTFDPRKQNSDANKLGIGGYHTITSVKSSISPGKFTTSIAGQQYYSGDKSGNPNTVKMKNADQGPGKIEEYKPKDEAENNDGFVKCNQVILNAQNYSFEEGTLAGTSAGSTSGSSSPPIETAETSEPQESDNSIEPASNEELGESPDSSGTTSEVITGQSQNESPTEVERFDGKLRTMKSSQTSTSSSGGQLVQSFTEEVGKFTEMSDGTIYFERFNPNGGYGPQQIIRDNSRIIRQ